MAGEQEMNDVLGMGGGKPAPLPVPDKADDDDPEAVAADEDGEDDAASDDSDDFLSPEGDEATEADSDEETASPDADKAEEAPAADPNVQVLKQIADMLAIQNERLAKLEGKGQAPDPEPGPSVPALDAGDVPAVEYVSEEGWDTLDSHALNQVLNAAVKTAVDHALQTVAGRFPELLAAETQRRKAVESEAASIAQVFWAEHQDDLKFIQSDPRLSNRFFEEVQRQQKLHPEIRVNTRDGLMTLYGTTLDQFNEVRRDFDLARGKKGDPNAKIPQKPASVMTPGSRSGGLRGHVQQADDAVSKMEKEMDRVLGITTKPKKG